MALLMDSILCIHHWEDIQVSSGGKGIQILWLIWPLYPIFTYTNSPQKPQSIFISTDHPNHLIIYAIKIILFLDLKSHASTIQKIGEPGLTLPQSTNAQQMDSFLLVITSTNVPSLC